jgi:hypothetical protein
LVSSANLTCGKVRNSSDKRVLAPARRLNLNFYAGKVVLLEEAFELSIELS